MTSYECICQKTKVPDTVTEGTLLEQMKISQKYDKSPSILIFIKKKHEFSMKGYIYSQWKGTRICVSISVADPWHFGVDPDPDPRIHASD